MKNIFKTFGIITLAVVMAFSMVACGDEEDPPPPPPPDDDTPIDPVWTAVDVTSIFGTDYYNNTIRAIAYGNGKFVAGGEEGKMAYSTDGITWTAVTDSTIWDLVENKKTYKTSINAIAYGDGKFVAGGGYGKMAYSTNGVTWTEVDVTSIFGSYGNLSINAIAYGDGKFVAGAKGGDSVMAFSSNGINWTAVAYDSIWEFVFIDVIFRSHINAIAYGDGKFVAGGSGCKMAISTDGETWTALPDSTILGFTIDMDYYYGVPAITKIVYGNNKFIAESYYRNGKMAISTDGVTWTALDVTRIFGSNSVPINTIAYGNGKFVTGRWTSTDGITWTATATGFSASAIAYGNGKFVAGGTDGIIAYLLDD